MAKDYAKTKKRDNRSSSRRGSSGFLWILALILSGFFAIALMYLKQQNERLELASEQTIAVPVPQKNHIVKSTQTPPAGNSTHLDFYNMLPKVQVPAPGSEPQVRPILPPVNPSAKSLVPATNTTSGILPAQGYIIQVGLFKDYPSADELKAEVTLQGFEVKITTQTVHGVPIYRVWLGPYNNRSQAQQQQQNLRANQIQSQLVKVSK